MADSVGAGGAVPRGQVSFYFFLYFFVLLSFFIFFFSIFFSLSFFFFFFSIGGGGGVGVVDLIVINIMSTVDKKRRHQTYLRTVTNCRHLSRAVTNWVSLGFN